MAIIETSNWHILRKKKRDSAINSILISRRKRRAINRSDKRRSVRFVIQCQILDLS
jgi:hypothetical protein